MHRSDELTESDVGKGCGLFEVRQIGDEYFAFVEDCEAPKACSVLLRGGSRDALNEIERNLQDAMQVARNVAQDPRLLPGGGATEMEIACGLQAEGTREGGVEAQPLSAVGQAMEIIPRRLCQNCGADTIRVMTKLRVGEKERGVRDRRSIARRRATWRAKCACVATPGKPPSSSMPGTSKMTTSSS